MRVTDRLKKNGLFTGLAVALSMVAGAPKKGEAAITPAREQADLTKSCASADPDFLCLGIRYVVYADQTSQPVVSPKIVAKNIAGINSIWKQCKIGFQIDEFISKSPDTAGLPVDTADFSDLDRIRQTFNKDSSLLVVTTYKWRRDGNLGHTPANAWTKMPGSGLYGVVLEQKVGNFPNIIAHELGHYLNLYHANERSEVMNAIIYDTSNTITQEQCETARAAVKKWWPNMVRTTAPDSPNAPQFAHKQGATSRKG